MEGGVPKFKNQVTWQQFWVRQFQCNRL